MNVGKDGLFFGPDAIAQMRRKADQFPWAAAALEKIQWEVQPLRRAFARKRIQLEPGQGWGTTFMRLAICGRLAGGWQAEAALRMLRQADDPSPFVFKQAHDLCLGLDFVQDIDAKLRKRLINRVLIPLGKQFMNEQRGGSNHQTTRNLSLLGLGLWAGRDDFLSVVLTDPARSYDYHLQHSVHPDGFWYEQSIGSYHLGTLDRLLRIRWMAGRHGLPLQGDNVLLNMLDTMQGAALPGGKLPWIGDVSPEAWQQGIFHPNLLELAYAMYKLPWVGWALRQTPRDAPWSLLVGETIRKPKHPQAESRVFESSGLCVLKQGQPEAYWQARGHGSAATITFGPHGDWHGHAGKLGIEYIHDGRYLVRDHGNSHGYDQPTHRLWFMATLAHSTLMVDGHNQAFTWCHDKPELQHETGQCHAFMSTPDINACTVSADFAYPGCHIKRTLFLASDHLLDITECQSTDGQPHRWEWLMHTGGTLQSDLPFAPDHLPCENKGQIPSPPDRPYSPGALMPSPYDHIREVMSLTTGDPWQIDVMDAKWASDTWKIRGRAMRLMMLAQPSTTIYKGVSAAAARDVYDPVILVRREGMRTTFIALHVPGEQVMTLQCLTNQNGMIACHVIHAGQRQGVIHFKQNAQEQATIQGHRFSGRLASLRLSESAESTSTEKGRG